MPRVRLQSRVRRVSPRDQLSSELVRAIKRLPPSYRDVFVLYRFSGMSLEQVGDHLNVKPKEVEIRLADALVHLAKAPEVVVTSNDLVAPARPPNV